MSTKGNQVIAAKSPKRIMILSTMLFIATVIACGMIVIRYFVTGSARFGYLLWNIFLAWIPFITALTIFTMFEDSEREKKWSVSLGFLFLLWLLFYPNAPYIFTDLIHLINNPRVVVHNRLVRNYEVLLWYDIIVSVSFAWLGHFLGLVSLYLVHRVLERLTTTVTAWVLVVVTIGLSGYGVFLGRFLRLNSWHIFTKPLETLHDISSYLFSFNSFAFSSAFAVFIFLTYLPAYAAASMRKARS